MAKASLWGHGINPLSIFSLVKPKNTGECREDEECPCPFIGKEIKVQNDFFQAMKKIVFVLSELSRRDSLTYLYELNVKGLSTIKDDTSLTRRLSEFKKEYECDNKKCSKPVPLSDREFKYSYFGGILLLSTFSKGFLGFFDTSGNDCIAMEGDSTHNPGNYLKNKDEWENEWKWGCKSGVGGASYDLDLSRSINCPRDKDGNMSVIIDTQKILEDLLKDVENYFENAFNCTEDCEKVPLPLGLGGINEKIDNFSGDFKEVEDVLNNFGFSGDGGTEGDTEDLKSEIEKYRAYTSFFKVATHRDEDGDGCIDEELLDGQDNDGDGFVNENSRLAPKDPDDRYWGVSSMNNSMYGGTKFSRYRNDENWEYNKPVRLRPPVIICNTPPTPDCSVGTELEPDEDGWVTVINFTQLGYPDGTKYWTMSTQEKEAKDLRLAVAQDTLCLIYNLEFRQKTIGGCWPYYDEQKFRDYHCRRSNN
jgi:hypothetical protein